MVEVHIPQNSHSPKLSGKPFYYQEMSRTPRVQGRSSCPISRYHHPLHSGNSPIFGESEFQWNGSMTFKNVSVTNFKSLKITKFLMFVFHNIVFSQFSFSSTFLLDFIAALMDKWKMDGFDQF